MEVSMQISAMDGESRTPIALELPTGAMIVDDHELFRRGLRELLESEPGIHILGEATGEDEAFDKFNEVNADLVTIDVSLSSGHGLNLATRIRKCKPTAIILVISMYEEEVFAERAIAAGASGYVSKQATSHDLLAALRAVRRGEIYLRPDIMQRLLKRKAGAKKLHAPLSIEQLSGRELVILSLIGQGMSTNKIAEELHLAISTVETYRERIKTKLGLASGAELIRHAVLWVMQTV
jgi:DNA-binding NarL/FixJ family response regulator